MPIKLIATYTPSRGPVRGEIDNNSICSPDESFPGAIDSAVVELRFSSVGEMFKTLVTLDTSSHPLFESTADVGAKVMVIAEEEQLSAGATAAEDFVKVMHFVVRANNVFPEDFYQYFRESHARAAQQSPEYAASVSCCEMSIKSRIGENLAPFRKQFGFAESPGYDLVVSHYFPDSKHAKTFVHYAQALQSRLNEYVNWPESFCRQTSDRAVFPAASAV